MVGPGKPIDTDRFFIICANVLGSCMGSPGPATSIPPTASPRAMRFPGHHHPRHGARAGVLLDHLGDRRLHAVVGGSMGGMQALSWPATFPIAPSGVLVIASTARHPRRTSPSTRSAARRSWPIRTGAAATITAPAMRPPPGLAVARMAAHITYLSEAGLTEKFGRRLQARDAKSFGFDADFQVESYLRHQGISFVDRFDANSYLYITRAMDYFDLAEEHGGLLANAFAATQGALLPGQLRHRLALSDRRIARDRPRAQRRRRAGQLRRAVRARSAMTPSCSTCPN